MVEERLESAIETPPPDRRSHPALVPALGLLALGTFIGSWCAPWIRSIGFSGNFRGTVDELNWAIAHADYAPATGSLFVWVLLFVLVLLGVASLWSRALPMVVAGVVASAALVTVLVVTSARVGPDAHAIIVFTPQDPISWETQLEPIGWLAIGASALLLFLTVVHVAARPWAAAPRRIDAADLARARTKEISL